MAARTEIKGDNRRFGLGEKLFLAFSIAAIVPILIALVSSISIYLRNIDSISEELVREKSRSARLLVIERTDRMTAFLDYVSRENSLNINLDLGLNEAVSGYLASLQSSADIDLLWVVSADGVMIRSPAAPEPLLQELSAENPIFGSQWIAGSGGRQFMVAARYLKNTAETSPGVLYGAIEIRKVLSKISTELSAPVFFASRNGELIEIDIHVTGEDEPDEDDIGQLEKSIRLNEKNGIFPGRLGGINYLFDISAYSAGGNLPLALIGVGYLNSAIADVRQGGLFGLVVSGLAMLLISGGISVYFTGTITGTARKIALTAREIANGKYGLETRILRNDELGDLAAEFDRMSRILREQANDRLVAEEELRQSEIQFRSIFNGVGEAIFVHDIYTGKIIDINDAALRMYGYGRDEIIDGGIERLSATEKGFDLAAASRLMVEARDGRAVHSEWLARDAHGRDFWIELGLQKAQIGGLERILVSVRDITERKLMEKTILEANSKLEATVERRTAALRDSNSELKTTLSNLERAQNKIVETEKLTVLGHLAAGIAHELNTPLGAIISSLGSFEYFLDSRFDALADIRAGLSEAERTVCEKILEIILPQIAGASKFNFNRSKKKEILLRLEEARIPDAKDLAEKISDWDIELDMESILPLLGGERNALMLDFCGEIFSLHRMIGITGLSAQKAVVVVNALRSYLHPENKDESSLIDIDGELENILILMKNKIKHSIEIKREYGHATAWGSPEKLGQVWINLINNAVEAMQYKGILALRTANEGNEVVVSITDNGPGVPADIQERIFEPFFSTKPRGEGLGLGLDICRKIIQGFGGTIRLESRSGHTCFTVRIPRENDDETSDSMR